MIATERERKLLIPGLPQDFAGTPKRVEQVYIEMSDFSALAELPDSPVPALTLALDTDSDEVARRLAEDWEFRVRRITKQGAVRYVATMKGPGSLTAEGQLSRPELEGDVDARWGRSLLDEFALPQIFKTRYDLHGIEADVFDAELTGLFLAEIEGAPSAETLAALESLHPFADVSADPRFQNRRLARTSQAEIRRILAEFRPVRPAPRPTRLSR